VSFAACGYFYLRIALFSRSRPRNFGRALLVSSSLRFVRRFRAGHGETAYADGSTYKGAWRDGYFHGYGELHYSNGTVYKVRRSRGTSAKGGEARHAGTSAEGSEARHARGESQCPSQEQES
jgi:hypothetical protein